MKKNIKDKKKKKTEVPKGFLSRIPFVIKFLFVLGIIISGIILINNFIEKSKKKQNLENLVKPRESVLNIWLKAGEKVARQSNDDYSNKVMGLLTNNAFLAMPHVQGLQFIKSPENPINGLNFVILLPNEFMPSLDWRQIANEENAGASFGYSSGSIILKKSDSLGEIAKAIIIIHEGSHAYEFFQHPIDSQNDIEYSKEETRVHAIQNNLLLTIGGSGYRAILNNEKERTSKEIIEKKLSLETMIPPRGPYDSTFETVFGPTKSLFERDFFQTSLWIHALFEIIDELQNKDLTEKENMKNDIMYSHYAAINLLPSKNK